MAGKLPKTGSGRARPQRIRPHWWAVLAVSLSLLALVAAATSDHPAWHGNRGRDVTASKGPKAKLVPPTVPSTSTSTETTSPTRSVRRADPKRRCRDRHARRHGRGGAPRHHTIDDAEHCSDDEYDGADDTRNHRSGARRACSADPVGVSPTAEHRVGHLPLHRHAGAMRVSVSWSPVDSLSLSVSCSGGTQSAEGTSSVAVVILDADGPCDLTLKELLVQLDTVSYTLTIAPASG